MLVLGLIGLNRTIDEGWGEAILSRHCNQEKKASFHAPHLLHMNNATKLCWVQYKNNPVTFPAG